MIGLILAFVLLSEKAFGGSVRIEDYSFRISPGEKTSSEVIVVNDADELVGNVDIRVLYDGACGEGSPGPDALSLTLTVQGRAYPIMGSSSGSFVASGVSVAKGSGEWRIVAVSDPRLCPGSYSSEISFEGHTEDADIKNEDVSEGPAMSFSAVLSEKELGEVGSVRSSGSSGSSSGGVLSVRDDLPIVPEEDRYEYIGNIISSVPGVISSARAMSGSTLGKIGAAVKDRLPIVVSSTAFAALAAAGLRRRYVKMNRDLLS